MFLKAAITGSLKELLQKEQDELADAARQAVESASATLQNTLRAQVRDAGLGEDLEKAWRREIYPRSNRKSTFPAALVYSKATRLHAAYNKGGVIRAQNTQWMVIPLPAAEELGFATDGKKRYRGGKRAHYSDLDAAIRRFGKLRPVYLKRGMIMLVADAHTGRSGSKIRYSKISEKRSANASVPLFLLVKQVRIKKLLDIEGPSTLAMKQLYSNLSNILGQHADHG